MVETKESESAHTTSNRYKNEILKFLIWKTDWWRKNRSSTCFKIRAIHKKHRYRISREKETGCLMYQRIYVFRWINLKNKVQWIPSTPQSCILMEEVVSLRQVFHQVSHHIDLIWHWRPKWSVAILWLKAKSWHSHIWRLLMPHKLHRATGKCNNFKMKSVKWRNWWLNWRRAAQ